MDMSMGSIAVGTAAAFPLAARLRLLGDRDLGAGNFLDKARAVSSRPEEPFLWAQQPGEPIVKAEPLSLASLTHLRDSYAAFYYGAGVRKGDPVGIYLADGIDPLVHFLALGALGAIPALVNGRMEPSVAAEYLRRVGVVGLVANQIRLDAVAAVDGALHRLRFAVDTMTLPTTLASGVRLPATYPYRPGDQDVVMLCHTSGTTGAPKAAMFGHRQFFLGKRGRLVNFPAPSTNRLLSALPQTHSAGISYLMTATLLGLPTFVMAEMSGEAVRDAMREFHPTMVVAFPQTYAALSQLELAPEAAVKVHTWINTGDSAHEAHIRALVRHGRRADRWGGRAGSRFIDGLGSSEMGMALFCKVSEPESTEYGRCVGRPVDVVQRATVFGDDGSELASGKVGRLGVRTPTVTPGYWNDAVLTARSSLSGYWLTGDLVYRDEQGRFHHVDRLGDVIHTAEGPIYSLPMEEAVLVGCPDVADCAIVAVADPAQSELSLPFASVKLGHHVTEPPDLLGTLNTALAARGLPALRGAVVARDTADFPVGPTGKVLKRRLRERFATALLVESPQIMDAATLNGSP